MQKEIQKINIQSKRFLLELARKVITQKAKKNILDNNEINSLDEKIKEKRGCFVTLTNNNDLRGCIGYILPIAPLYQTVIENAYNAAFCDPRFNPVTDKEIKNLKIEISALTIPEKLKYTDKNDLLAKIIPYEDGLIIKKGFYSSTFLPQVWEQLPEKENFLDHLCLKAGLSPNEWEKGELDVEIYKVEAFAEK